MKWLNAPLARITAKSSGETKAEVAMTRESRHGGYRRNGKYLSIFRPSNISEGLSSVPIRPHLYDRDVNGRNGGDEPCCECGETI